MVRPISLDVQNMKVRGQLVLKLEWKQADWRTRPIALHFQLTRFLCCVWCNKLLLLLLRWWWNVGLWPANFPCPALDLQLMSDH